ncbi:hypothetical protein Bca4012_034910 [Brassica carinata]
MAAMKLLLSQARRQALTKPFSSPFPQINRLFSSSDSNPNPPPPPNESPKKLEPVSYAAKPSSPEDRSTLTREEIRYTKDSPSLTPVSYAHRVAPLPEDRVADEENRERTPEEVEMERKRIESENRARRRFLRANAGNAKAKFDETLEAHVRLGIEKGRSELDVRVAFFAEGSDAEDAKAAGADVVGGLELIEEILKSGKIDFDRCLATPKMMPRVYKQGSVTKDVMKAVKDAKAGHTKFRMDKTSILHVPLGKMSFPEDALRENVGAFMNALLLAKPAGLKKSNSPNPKLMGKGYPVSIQSLSRAADHYTKLQLK